MFSVKWIVGVVAAVALLISPLAVIGTSSGQEFEGNITAGGPPFAGGVVGTFEIEVKGNEVEIEAEVDISVPSGFVLEGWLVDAPPLGGTGYKLSLGLLEDGELDFAQNMVNVFTYNFLVITMEPAGDPDPNAAAPVAGAVLGAPFGQN